MADITEEDVLNYLATCFNTTVEMMPPIDIQRLPNKHHLEWCKENNVNKFVKVTISILGYACHVYWKYYEWIDYSKWNNQNIIVRNWGDAVKNWILLKKLEMLIN